MAPPDSKIQSPSQKESKRQNEKKVTDGSNKAHTANESTNDRMRK